MWCVTLDKSPVGHTRTQNPPDITHNRTTRVMEKLILQDLGLLVLIEKKKKNCLESRMKAYNTVANKLLPRHPCVASDRWVHWRNGREVVQHVQVVIVLQKCPQNMQGTPELQQPGKEPSNVDLASFLFFFFSILLILRFVTPSWAPQSLKTVHRAPVGVQTPGSQIHSKHFGWYFRPEQQSLLAVPLAAVEIRPVKAH